MTTASLRAGSRHVTFALALAALVTSGSAGASRAGTHAPMLASDTGWQGELVNRPTCGSDRDYDRHPACEAGRHYP
jgi:hypothetical protein